jgi:hypothetical protein
MASKTPAERWYLNGDILNVGDHLTDAQLSEALQTVPAETRTQTKYFLPLSARADS